jgi:thiol-disulfide isomerase/thioredoxin
MVKLSCFFTLLLLFSCSIEKEEQYLEQKQIVIAGRVQNFDSEKMNIDLNIYRICQERETITTNIDSLGNFYFSFNGYIPIQTSLTYKTNVFVLANPGDSLYLEFDGKLNSNIELLKNIRFSGDAAQLNKDIAAFQILYYSANLDNECSPLNDAIANYDIAEYELYLDTLQLKRDELFEKFVSTMSPNHEAKVWASVFLKQEVYEALVTYPFQHQFENQTLPGYCYIPVSYYDRLLNITPIDYTMLINGFGMSRYIEKYLLFYGMFNIYAEESHKQHNTKPGYFTPPIQLTDSLVIAGLIKNTPDELLRQMILTEHIRRDLELLKIDYYKENMEFINLHIKEPFLKNPLLKKYEQIKERLENPQIASNAILEKLEGSTAKQIMDSILNRNNGKVIYIDCWADYCGPCRAEMPNSKELFEKMIDKDVAFVYVCIDSKEESWKAILDEFQLSGQHYWLTEAQSDEWKSAFNITGVPYYFLIDKQKIVVEFGSHLRPIVVEDKIVELLE